MNMFSFRYCFLIIFLSLLLLITIACGFKNDPEYIVGDTQSEEQEMETDSNGTAEPLMPSGAAESDTLQNNNTDMSAGDSTADQNQAGTAGIASGASNGDDRADADAGDRDTVAQGYVLSDKAILEWQAVAGATKYIVTASEGSEILIEKSTYVTIARFPKPKDCLNIEVKAVDDSDKEISTYTQKICSNS